MTELVPNLRDLGGMRVDHTQMVRANRLFRSALPLATDFAHPELTWPPATVIDLRSTAEIGEPHPLSELDVQIHNVALLAELAPGQVPPGSLVELYGFVLDTVPDRLVSVVDLVAVSDGATLIHCAAGKDRTGIAAALILRILGVSRELVIADYLATNNHADEIRRRLSWSRRVFDGDLPAHFLEVPVEAIVSTLNRWDEHPHGVVGWARDAGLQAESIQQLRENLLVNHEQFGK